jgi:hypothetical protein
MAGEVGKLNDPNYAISLAVGPPLPALVQQQPGHSGLRVGGHYEHAAKRCVRVGACFTRGAAAAGVLVWLACRWALLLRADVCSGASGAGGCGGTQSHSRPCRCRVCAAAVHVQAHLQEGPHEP